MNWPDLVRKHAAAVKWTEADLNEYLKAEFGPICDSVRLLTWRQCRAVIEDLLDLQDFQRWRKAPKIPAPAAPAQVLGSTRDPRARRSQMMKRKGAGK